MRGEPVSAEAMLTKLWSIEERLRDAGIVHDKTVYRFDAISLRAYVPGEIWEIDVVEDGSVDFEVFKMTPMQGEAELQAAIADVKTATNTSSKQGR